MRVVLKMEGGIAYFPGLHKPISLDSDTLPAHEANELKQKVNAADFFNLPSVIEPVSPRAADYRKYTITVEDDGRSHTVQVSDPIADPNLSALVSYITKYRSV